MASNHNNKQRYTNWGELLYWVYANLNMCNAAITSGKNHYDRLCFIIRSKAFKAYKEGRWKIHSLYENNNLKMDWGKDHCWYCNRPTVYCGKLSTEHIFPRIKGGDDNFDNIAYACKSCNSSKGHKDLIEWMVQDKGITPPFSIVCIYMKLVYKFSVENGLMDYDIEQLAQLDLPFSYKSLFVIETLIKENLLNSSTIVKSGPTSSSPK